MIDLGGRKFRDDETIVVAPLVAYARHPPGTTTHEWPCVVCGRTTLIDDRSLDLNRDRGMAIACLGCAIDRYPEMYCFADPATGQMITLRQAVAAGVVRHPEPKEDT